MEFEKFEGTIGEKNISTNNSNKFQIAGLQFPGEDGITRDGIYKLLSMLSGVYFDFIKIEGENTATYFIVDSDIYQEIDLPNFKNMIINIIDDMRNETPEGIYQFGPWEFYFSY